MAAEGSRPEDGRMTSSATVLRRAAGALVLCLAVAACGGGDDDDAASDPNATTSESCDERFVALLTDPDMVAAAEAGGDLPADVETQLDALEAECGDDIDEMDDAQFTELMADVDPAVIAYLGESATEEFEVTGDSIGDAAP
jgi:hypothetical protein